MHICFLFSQIEKAKQDDTLSDLSNVLDQLKEMAVDMGSEIERLDLYFNFIILDDWQISSQSS